MKFLSVGLKINKYIVPRVETLAIHYLFNNYSIYF